MNKISYAVAVILAVLLVAYVMTLRPSSQSAAAGDYKNIAYMIEGESVKLVDGVAEVEAAPGSASKFVTKYFGNEAKGDLNGDGIPDLAFLLTRDMGGSGTFFYVVGAIQKPDGTYAGTDGVFLGDRIAPQTTEIRDGKVIVNFATRRPDEPMTARPSVGKSIYLKLNVPTMQFGEVVQDFEGEADPSKMTLGMHEWHWIETLLNDGTKVVPKQEGKFTLTFDVERFSAKTDCNSMSGSYTEKGGALSFGPIAMTKMFCEGSQDGDYAKLLENAALYHFTSRGELILELKYDSGTATFR